MRVKVAVLLACLLSTGLAAGCRAVAGTAGGGDAPHWIRIGGMLRRYLVHLPPGARSAAGLPVVLAFHGGLGTASGMSRLTHLDVVADRLRFVVVCPQGFLRSWNDGRPNTPAHAHGVDDVAFVSALIGRLVSVGHADASRIYATGISNGAMFTELLGCRLAGQLAAIAPVAGPMPVPADATCHPRRPVSVLLIHGTADPIVPYDGGHVNGRGRGGDVRSVAWTYRRWRAIDHCPGRPVTTWLPVRRSDGTKVSRTASPGCAAATSTVLYTVRGGGHTWPGGLQYLPVALVGRTTRQLDASQVILRFFAGLR